MTTVLALTNAFIFTLLGLLHLYWMLGGKWGLAQALPSSETGEGILKPGPAACLIVALGLLGFAFYNISLGLGWSLALPFGLEKWGIWVLAAIFMLRAIGDFRFIGFFKKVKNTVFGKMDTRWYAPLCLYLGLSSAWIGWATTNHAG